ncbi:uncharacterized protein LOC129959638 [Argiope bruennichi]|uniref:Uncharacterized protein n=1 Tax=Argiope bruennichi TaxID=94029 RepID=A0A8T0FNZ2_ARGBR|nr:uncharacterized protein LOC129959638 [Argiope bruennichi]XP_055928493.1 uncharacterized protein LOC129959638 [Argiope bruennichi]XP_055928494.1 uncharacterized protein LOC129959638 [Argiope bruennichi]XP_055928495.1 uncharacterized protein LOC129959638 [Argiope bruennichi]KAF8791180.1 hypothetical protein HNY73_006095 [Argiope bruennichi]
MYLFLILFATLQVYINAEIRHTSGGNDFCIVDGRPYRNGERIPRDHVCHICLCHQGRVECSWMNCPPPPEGCTEFTVPNYCNPTLYICSIPENLRESRTSRLVRRASDTAASGLDFSNQSAGDCTVLGVPYRTGDLMGIATKFCLECRCGRQNMFCSPRCCFKHASLHENVSDREAAVRGPVTPDKHPLYHLFK